MINVLLVDDEIAFVDVLCRRLSRRDMRILRAHSAEEAMPILENDKVDVVVLDVKMPVTDGLTALKIIRNNFPEVEVIMLTGHCDLEDAVGGMENGAFDYLLKPVSLDELVLKIIDANTRKLLRQKNKNSGQ
ncbi:response regulator [Maridesulfovibrio bastinii]|jgi:DNA-binding NtrC family response regulator|uniref:response regulator n=1 Tax=Maridesulfovibrio bastinii TaxID=47157 RepID=UPI000429BE24|nr:response regulator [Maridesulfovibrio bastinii]